MIVAAIHRADTRGTTNQGWLHSRHSFSFGGFYDADRLHFGALRAINDEMMAPGKGYGTHPHSNMEVITIPLEGELEYKDEFGHKAIIRPGDVQVLSAGTGVFQREINISSQYSARYVKICILPHLQKLKPRYSVASYQFPDNALTEILSTHFDNDKLWVYQDVWMSVGRISEDSISLSYQMHRPGVSGLYIFVLKGTLKCGDILLVSRDGMALKQLNKITFATAHSTEFLLIEVPLEL
ncbi:MAG: pirin family protein [Paludibacteraceae bacterium]|nr:pirin family protein [Paludibacteraceae bacterium]